MSAPFVTALRLPREPIVLGAPSGQKIRVRAQVLEAWDAIRIDANPDETVRHLKQVALAELYPNSAPGDEFVVKLHGFEILDEDVSLTRAGAVDGSIFLIADKRRRPVQ